MWVAAAPLFVLSMLSLVMGVLAAIVTLLPSIRGKAQTRVFVAAAFFLSLSSASAAVAIWMTHQ